MKPVTAKPKAELAEPGDIGMPLVEDDTEDAPSLGLARLRLLWAHRRMLLVVVAWGVVLSTLIAFVIPKQYQSTTQLVPPDNQNSSGMALMAALTARTGMGMVGSNLLGMKSTGALFIGILRSRTVQERLVERFDLKKVYGASLSDGARRVLAKNTAIKEDLKSGIITITVTDKDPKRAAAIAAAYVTELNGLVVELSTSAAHRERVFLEERLKAVKQDLDAAAKDYSEFSSKNATIDIKEQGRAMVEAAATLQGQLVAAKSELRGLEQIYTDGNVRVRAIRARISELEGQIEQVNGKTSAGVPKRDESGKSYPSIRDLPLLGVTYADLYRRTKIQETVYETLTQEYELAKVQETKEIPSVKVLDAADVPERKAYPPRTVIMFLGTLLAFALGVVWIFAASRWQKIDRRHPTKRFVLEVFESLKADLPWPVDNRLRAATGTFWSGFVHHRSQAGDQPTADQDRLEPSGDEILR